MSESDQSIGPPWYESPRFRAGALSVLAVILMVKCVIAVFFRNNDFLCHRHVGQAFLDGDPYPQNGFIMYPVGRTMMNSLLAIGPLYLTRAICFMLALLAVFACYRIWRRLSESTNPTPASTTTAAAIFTTILMLAYVLRDLDECGLQLFLLFFLSVALSDLAQGRHMRAGFWLATAATYKVTPILVLPYLLWKRQWRAACWTVVFVGVWAAAAVPFIGLEKTIESQQKWVAHIRLVMANRQAYPDQLVEPQRTDNLSLVALLARNLETYPPDHTLYIDHPLFFQPGALAPEAAYAAVRLLLLALGLILAWRFRRSGTGNLGSNGMVVEWAAVCLLCAIVSPICWKQHMVLALPAVFIVVRTTLALQPPARWRIAALIAFGMAANLGRSFLLGKDLSALYHAYKFDTLLILLVLVLILTLAIARTKSAGLVAVSSPTGEKALAA